MRATLMVLRNNANMSHKPTLNQPNALDEEHAAEMAANFLRNLQNVSSKLNHYNTELSGIADGVVRLERTGGAANFALQFWQLSGYRRSAEIQVARLRALLSPALHAYPCPQSRIAALSEIHIQIERTESALREVRLFWRELSATYHFMLGVNGVLV